ncbi:hypothetical protein KIL84_004484 [Mauremys mutica]|uniref:Uncharacterized protein n=1 Tax=Mauremys mutica TaxID=74926 RepID=A0A9D3XN21_9SAUR|nr:hypothetical protein KIL84_004484 [Mauremys mutica]
MQTTIAAAASDSACHSILLLTNKGKRNYYNSTYRGRISLSDRLLFTVKNASEWMAGEYQVITDLSKTCTACINLTVPGPVSFPPPISETPAASPTGEGSSRGMLSNGSPEGEPRSHYGVWISLGFITALFTATALCLLETWERRTGNQTRHRHQKMEDENGYAIMTKRIISTQPSQHRSQGSPPVFDGYKVAVGVLGAVCVLLVLAVIAQHVWGFQAGQASCSGKCDIQQEAFISRLRQSLCDPARSGPAVGARCALCPKDWQAHKGKCYWDSKRSQIWNASQKDCELRNSQMLVIQDQEEMVK